MNLYHVGARAYDPRTARWLQRDPSDADSGDPNLYRFCGNDPINLLDPDGESWVVDPVDFIPFVGSGRDLIQGIREGNWVMIGIGVGGLILDCTTFGTGTIVKGIAKGGLKSALRNGAKQVSAGSTKSAVARGTGATATKGAAKNATRKTVKHHIMTNKNYKRGKQWSKQFEDLLDECNARYLLNDPANLVELDEYEHRIRAPHSDGYHGYIYEQVKRVVDKYKHDPKLCEKKLKQLLRWLGRKIKKKPDMLRM